MKPRPSSLIVAALLLASISAGAAWQEIEQFEDGMRVYVDMATVRRHGDTAEVLHLVRWPEPQEEPGLPPYRSTIVRTQYDCVGKQEQYLSSTSFSGVMGDGAKTSVDSNAAEQWYPVSDASMEEKLWKMACGVK